MALRDPHSGFIAYAPKGALAKAGPRGARGGRPALRHLPRGEPAGLGDVPGIAGRSRSTLRASSTISRPASAAGPSAALMKAPVEKLDGDDVLAISAYVTSLAP